MNLFRVGVLGAFLVVSLSAVAEETRIATNMRKQEMPARERVEPKRRAAQQRAQKRPPRRAKQDASLDWPQLG